MNSSSSSNPVQPARPRGSVQARFPHGQVYEAPPDTTLEAFVRAAGLDRPIPVVAALVDGQVRELTDRLERDGEIGPLTMATNEGMRIYHRSLCFLLIVAARELFPQATVIIDHSLTLGGLFCRMRGRGPFSAEELERLEKRMAEIVEADEPITRQEVPLAEAEAIFREQGHEDKVRLLAYRHRGQVPIYTLRGVRDYFYGHMVPSTGYLRIFELRPYPPGFILRFPLRDDPTRLPPYHDVPKLAAVFQEHTEWMEVMEVQGVAALNRAVESGRIQEVILVAEALHERRVAQIAHDIARQQGRVRLVLIAGPSSSGKTTFAKRLAIQLLADGLRPVPLELDNYFVDREHTPRDEKGEYDYESLAALDVALFNRQLEELLAGREVIPPRYNFLTGRREEGPRIALGPRAVILAEGLHGLNPALLSSLLEEGVYRIYISALTQLNLDHHNRISTTDTRLLRRLVRDARARGHRPEETIRQWDRVVRGEFQNIFPYQENAEVMFNSALVYELAVLKPLAEPLLRQVEPGGAENVEARRLLAFLEWFLPCGAELIPDNSILREFIGGSILRDFQV